MPCPNVTTAADDLAVSHTHTQTHAVSGMCRWKSMHSIPYLGLLFSGAIYGHSTITISTCLSADQVTVLANDHDMFPLPFVA